MLCKENFDCDVGLFCDPDSKICKTQFEFGLDCQSTYQCVNNCLCNFNKCIFYFSLSDKQPTELSHACLSGYSGYPIFL